MHRCPSSDRTKQTQLFGSSAAWSIVIGLSLFACGCGSSPTSPSNNAPFSQADLQVGTGATAVNGGTLTVHYTGWFYNTSAADHKGPQFETSRGGTAFTFTLGIGQVIPGWDRGVLGMKVGGVRSLVVPPSLAYGSSRNGIIPPNATLLFEIELLDAQ
jgi:FKBP-type peptidyl-prolyl cis-trans isomerase FkpA